ncbi:2-oxoglutarate dehydrogenase complex dihydrolipoyllysine-residue succinyltransferase [Peribacillus tepidiphilus]|uniref:2-oxoglutarate dehydrogenase complex dihydrolipoyllysine-residue succinyltransferase n=1 Tax=Peribacillus tepidiphilus TaxID=2652445 RepID=UPI001290F1E8|nr:2-oxoglutarate dehydrogenase complex dihydrolipoyllysine-residue succinyltransferase [Peribacillus tepidiphilus]
MAEIIVPELAESISEGTIAQWLKKTGEKVEKGDYIAELETDKVNVEIISEHSGVVTQLLKKEGDTVAVGEIIAIVDEDKEKDALVEKEHTSKPDEQVMGEMNAVKVESIAEQNHESVDKFGNRPIASPAARKLAREKGIDLSSVQAQDPLGRIRKHDIEATLIQKDSQHKQQIHSPQPKQAAQNKSAVELFEKPVEVIKMSRRRQTIAKRLVEAQHTAAMLTTFNEVDMTAILDLRKRRKEAFERNNDVKLGFMSFFTKAVIGALKKYPLLNAEIQDDEIIVKKYYDIGIAVAADDGLVVPVVRDADKLGFAGIEKKIAELAEKARNNKLSLSDLQGGTFTITNGGIFGSLMSTPILNAPQVGILGMHKIQLRPVAIDEERMENRPMMYIALSYDHRIVDGKEAVGFLAKVKELLEDPEQLLLEG